MSGYFEIGIYSGKCYENFGTLWRSAYQLGAAGIFIIGARFKVQASDTSKTWRHIPLREYLDFKHFQSSRPYDCPIVGVEMEGVPLGAFCHPKRAVYLLGSEDFGLPPAVRAACQHIVSLESMGRLSYNVAVAGSLVMYDRCFSNRERPNV